MGDPPTPSKPAADQPDGPPDTESGRNDLPKDGTDRNETSAEEQARIDRRAGDVADDIADFA